MTPDQIKQGRKAHRWSQADLAQRLGSTVTQVSRWENGHQSPGYEAENRLRALFAGQEPETEDNRLARIEARLDTMQGLLEQLLARG